MPGPLIGAATAAIGGGLNYFSNKQNNQANLNLYREQKQDNLDFFDIQNDYNHPSNQRKRLESAGLNPALMYGNGAAGGASGQASPIQKADIGIGQQRQPNFDFVTQSLNSYYDVKIKQAQYDNIRQQATTSDSLDALQVMKRGLFGEQRSAQDLKNQIFRSNLDFHAQMPELRVKELQQEIANKAQKGRGYKSDANMKELDFKLYDKLGIGRNTPFWAPMQAKLLKNSSDNTKINTILSTHLMGQIMGKVPKLNLGKKKIN